MKWCAVHQFGWSSPQVQVVSTQNTIEAVLASNNVGPEKYIGLYSKYADLVCLKSEVSKAEEEAEAFVAADKTLEQYTTYIEQLMARHDEILALPASIPFGLFRIDATALHQDLAGRAKHLADFLITRYTISRHCRSC